MLIITAMFGGRWLLSVAGFSRWGEVRHAFGGEARDFTREERHVVVGLYGGIHDRVHSDGADDAADAYRSDRTQNRADAPDADWADRARNRAEGTADAAVSTDAVGVEGIPHVGLSH
jgi:hypothetical protein